jgi:hypothetical protein
MTDPTDAEGIALPRRETIHIDAVRNDDGPKPPRQVWHNRQKYLRDIVTNRDQTIDPFPSDARGEISLKRFDGMQAKNALSPVQMLASRGPDGMIPTPFKPNDLSPRQGIGQFLSRWRVDETNVEVLIQEGHQRREKRILPLLNPVSEK